MTEEEMTQNLATATAEMDKLTGDCFTRNNLSPIMGIYLLTEMATRISRSIIKVNAINASRQNED